MFNKENRELIEKMNTLMGTKHRALPYDMNNASDLERALLFATAAYRDYSNYRNILLELAENFDESIEHYDTVTWLSFCLKSNEADDIIAESDEALDHAAGMFEILADRAKKHCAMIIRAVLTAPPETQKTVLGSVYDFKPDEIDEKIKELFMSLSEVDYYHNMQQNRDALLETMKELWLVKV
jgi:hypothetical protein